jgi:hypothetical protein
MEYLSLNSRLSLSRRSRFLDGQITGTLGGVNVGARRERNA